MTTIAFDETLGDIKIIDGDLVILTGSEEVESILRSRLRTFLGEWFLDTRIGVPFHEEILVKNPNFERIDSILKDTIILTDGVIELLSFNIEYDGSKRSLVVDFSVRAEDGIINIREVF